MGETGDCTHWGDCLEEARAKLRNACIINPPQTDSKYELCSSWVDSFNSEIDSWNNSCT